MVHNWSSDQDKNIKLKNYISAKNWLFKYINYTLSEDYVKNNLSHQIKHFIALLTSHSPVASDADPSDVHLSVHLHPPAHSLHNRQSDAPSLRSPYAKHHQSDQSTRHSNSMVMLGISEPFQSRGYLRSRKRTRKILMLIFGNCLHFHRRRTVFLLLFFCLHRNNNDKNDKKKWWPNRICVLLWDWI